MVHKRKSFFHLYCFYSYHYQADIYSHHYTEYTHW
jgi:hypothetical protein